MALGFLSRIFGNAGVPVNSPTTDVLWPDERFSLISGDQVRSIPAVERALGVIVGTVKQLPLEDYRDADPQPRPRFLDRPDPNACRSWWVGQNVTDYLLHGNAISYVTARYSDGYPAAAQWIPAVQVSIAMTGLDYPDDVEYWHGGRKLDRANVLHVRRGADEWWPARGVGVVEQHLGTFRRARAQSDYETSTLQSGAVPSVAVITPNVRLSEEEAEAAKKKWIPRFGGRREPVFLPNGTQVIPLAWSPSDTDLNEARKLSLIDVANIFNLDSFWLGAPSESLTYRSSGPLYHVAMRTTVEPVLVDFEGMWGPAVLPYGHRLVFDREPTQYADLATSVATMKSAIDAGILSPSEARRFLPLPVDPDAVPERPAASSSPTVQEEP